MDTPEPPEGVTGFDAATWPQEPDDLQRVVILDEVGPDAVTEENWLGYRRYGLTEVTLTDAQVEALVAGRTLGVDIKGEYVMTLRGGATE